MSELVGRLLVVSVSRRGKKSAPKSNHAGIRGMSGNPVERLTILGYDPIRERSVYREWKEHGRVPAASVGDLRQ